MNCQNCGKKEATVRYTQIINGIKSEIRLCENCAKKLGVGAYQFDLPIGFTDFLGDFFDDYGNEMIPSFFKEEVSCKKCGTAYEDFIQNGLLGCPECYETFGYKLDSILDKIQGASKHVGRGVKKSKIKNEDKLDEEKGAKISNGLNKTKDKNTDDDLKNKINELNESLKKAIKDERYEDAAKIRDELKKYNNKNN